MLKSSFLLIFSLFLFSCSLDENDKNLTQINTTLKLSRLDSLRKASFDELSNGTLNYVDFYNKAKKIDSTNLAIKIYHSYSVAQFKNDKIAAIREIRDILKQNPSNPDVFFALGTVFYTINLDSSFYYCEKSLAIDSMNYMNWYNLSTYYDEQKLYAKAIRCINKSIKLLPNKKSELQLVRGSYKLGLKDYQGAFDDMDTIPPSYTKKSNIYFNRSKCLFYLKRFSEAVEDCNRIIAKEKESTLSETYLIRGASKLGLNQKDSAYSDIKKAYNMGNKDAIDIYNKLTEYYKTHKKS